MGVDSRVLATLPAHRSQRSVEKSPIMNFKRLLLCCGVLMLLPYGLARSLHDAASSSQTSGPTATRSSSTGDKLVCNSLLVPQQSLVNGATTQGMEDARVFRADRGIAFQAYIEEELEQMTTHIAENDDRTHIRAVMSALFNSEQTLEQNYTILVPPTADIEVLQRLDSLGSDVAAPDQSTPLHILPGRWTVEDLLNNAILNRTVETLQGASLQLKYSSEGYVQPTVDEVIRPGHAHLPTRLNFTHLLSTANLHDQQIESCKLGSMILQINAVLTQGLSIESLRTIVQAVHDPIDSNSADSDASNGSPSTFVCTSVSGNWVECKARSSVDQNSGQLSRNIGVSPNSDGHGHGQFLPLSLTVLCCVAFLVGFYVVRKLRGGTEAEGGRGLGRTGPARGAHRQELAASLSPTVRVEAMPSVKLENLVPGMKLIRLGATQWKTTPVETATPGDTSGTPVDTSGTPVDTDATGAPAGTALPFQHPTTNACAASVCITVSQEEENSNSNSSLHWNANSNGLRENSSSNKEVTCVICMEAQGDHVLLPCGHGGYCHACAHQLLASKSLARMCPMCRAKLTAAVQVHMHTAVGEEGGVLRGIHVKSGNCEGTSDKRVR